MLIACLGLFELLLQRLARRGYFCDLSLLNESFVLLPDQLGLCVEIGDAITI